MDHDLDHLLIAASDEAKMLHNPLKKVIEDRKMPTNPDKKLLNLSAGNLSGTYGTLTRARAYA